MVKIALSNLNVYLMLRKQRVKQKLRLLQHASRCVENPVMRMWRPEADSHKGEYLCGCRRSSAQTASFCRVSAVKWQFLSDVLLTGTKRITWSSLVSAAGYLRSATAFLIMAIQLYADKTHKGSAMCKTLGILRATLYRYLQDTED